MKKKIVLIGGGGHAKVVIDIIKSTDEYEIVGICDENTKEIGGLSIIGGDEVLPQLYAEGIRNAFICIGALGNPEKRWKIYEMLKKIGYALPVLTHQQAIVSSDVSISEGTCIMPGVVINAGAQIGEMAIINTASIIEHDCIIGKNTHISPGACLCGGVSIGNHTHIGARSVVNQQLRIGDHVILGSGSVVVSHLSNNVKAYGVPAKIHS